MTHLTPAEFVDAVEGTIDSAGRQHLATCESCRREVARTAQWLGAAAGGPVPEPSPLFWDHFSARVRDAISAEADARQARGGSPWLRWSALVPLGTLAALVLAVVATMPRGGVAPHPSESVAPVPPISQTALDDRIGADAEWHALAELVGPLDWETAGEAGLAIAPGDADLALLDLSDDEWRELSRVLAGELGRDKS